MKLYKIIGPNNHEAMIKVQDILGPEALVYSTKKVKEGVEVLAGYPENSQEEVVVQNSSIESLQIQKIQSEIALINANLQELSLTIQRLTHEIKESNKKFDIKIWLLNVIAFLKKFYREGRYGRHISRAQ